MTSRALLQALMIFVTKAVEDYPFPSASGEWRDCRVFLHGLPDGQDEETYPFVVVRWQEGEIESLEDARTILQDTVLLILGVHAPQSQEQAGLLCAELLDCLRRALWKQRILDRRFELVEPLRSSMLEPGRQQHRFYMASIVTVWNYVWPPKAMELVGMSQTGFDLSISSYSAQILEKHDLR